MKRVISFVCSLSLLMALVGCGGASSASSLAAEQPESTPSAESSLSEELDAMQDVEVEENLFSVTLTVPKEYATVSTQEELDEWAKADGVKSATLNSDGSVTYVITKEKHEEIVNSISDSLDQAIDSMIGDENYPHIKEITHTEDFSSFTVITDATEETISDSMAAIGLFVFSKTYCIYADKEFSNCHVDFINFETNEIVDTADSDNLE